MQWRSFAQACCEVAPGKMRRMVAFAIVAQLAGALMLAASNLFFWTSLFAVASVASLAMILLAVELQLRKGFEFLARPLLRAKLVLWTLYPTTRSLRLVGWIGTQTEQVLVLSALDFCMALLLLAAILASHMHTFFRQAQTVLAHVHLNPVGAQHASPTV
ncbi:unnamed protein product [Prorocentrum cordatum]|uniref:Uncharacterized protein n=1 Tax=Prorocentrum cordatum TaxID=2364126 RepID=A0ABN9SSR4_9DINO|nr:unnamed protein product [Polarella glacialis]